jgi:hypothetical protein
MSETATADRCMTLEVGEDLVKGPKKRSVNTRVASRTAVTSCVG